MDDKLLEQARSWHAATARDDCDWERFTRWLEASPLHRQAYDDLALLEDSIARHAPALRAEVPVRGPRRGASRAWIGAAVAAGVVLLAVLGWRMLPQLAATSPRTFTAQAGSAELSLAGGMRVVLAPGSTLVASGRRDERLRLEGGAWFDVPHDPRRQLVIAVGPYEVRDIGTRFEAMSAGALLKIAVTEGEVGVMLPGHAQPTVVPAGHRLLVADDPPVAEYGDVAATEVAGWREGRLVFRNEPLSLVAPQLGLHAGLVVTVDPSIAQRRFSGVLAIGDGTQLVAQLAGIMGLREQRDGAVVRLAAGGEPAGR